MTRLTNKVAIITGGASGIGEGTVRKFVTEGAKVIIADVQDEAGVALQAELGESVLYQHTNVSDEADVKALVDLTMSHFGRLDTIFNNAGFGGVRAVQDLVHMVGDFADAEWVAANERLCEEVVDGLALAAAAAVPDAGGFADAGESFVGVDEHHRIFGSLLHAEAAFEGLRSGHADRDRFYFSDFHSRELSWCPCERQAS